MSACEINAQVPITECRGLANTISGLERDEATVYIWSTNSSPSVDI